MKTFVRYSLKQVVFINVVFVLLIVAGVYCLFTTPVENMPPVDIGRVFINTVYYGASAEDVEKLVTKEIEDAIDGLENVEYIRSRSLRNYSSVDVKFIDDSDYESLYDDLRFRVLNIKDELPAEVDDPAFFYIDTQVWMPVIVVDILGDIPNHSLKLLGDELKTNILHINGVREVDLSGEYRKEFHVSLNPEKLRALGVTFNQAAEAIRSANTKKPTGRFREGTSAYMLDAGKRVASQEDVLNIVVRRDGDGNFIRVRDLVTTARISHRDPDVIASVNGKNSLSLLVKKEDSGNAITIAEHVKKLSGNFAEVHKDDGISVAFTWDSTIEIHDSIRTLSGNLILGLILVMLVLWLTLGFRNAMLTAIGLPFSFLVVAIIMKFTTLTINTISIFSFVLVSGIIVDDAVIILENVYRHMQMGKNPKEAIVDGMAEIMLPVISSALTTIMAFVPMLIMTGSTGEFFSVIPKAVSFALGASLIEALIILPIHILEWGPKKNTHPVSYTQNTGQHLSSGVFAPLWKLYYRILGILLRNKLKTISLLSGVFLLALMILFLSITGKVPLIKVKFFPGSFFRYHVPVIMPRGSAIEHTDEFVRALSKFISSLGDKQALAIAGTAGRYEDKDYALHIGHHYGQVVVTLPKEKDRELPENPKNDLMLHLEYIREKAHEFINEQYKDNPQKPVVSVFPESTGPPVGRPVNIRIAGDTMENVLAATNTIMDYIRSNEKFSDLTDLSDNREKPQKVVKYTPKLEAAYEFGLSPGEISSLVAGTLNGRYAGEFRTSDEEVDLLIRLARKDDEGNFMKAGISTPSDILDIPLIEHSASPVFLRDIVEIQYADEPDIKTRYNGNPAITITSDIKAGSRLSTSRVQVLVKRFFDTIANRYQGVTVDFGGEFESTSRSYTSLVFAFLIAILAIYVILATQFKDYLQPLIILSAVTFSIIGVTFGMFVTQSTFTVGSFLAVIGLAGVAVNDSLILIDFINVRRREGMSVRDAVTDACSLRMRPVLITTITTILGLLPMAIGIPRKSITWAPMATAFVTGLSSATILTLLIIPVLYELSERLKNIFRQVTGKEQGRSISQGV
jgi:HAE1 family hydrophobic/amphiphilic exporter-1